MHNRNINMLIFERRDRTMRRKISKTSATNILYSNDIPPSFGVEGNNSRGTHESKNWNWCKRQGGHVRRWREWGMGRKGNKKGTN